MSPVQYVLLWTGLALIAAAVAGIVARGRYRLWWSLALYLVSVLTATTLQTTFPQRFHTAEFWQVKETIYTALRFAMALEVSLRTFRAFPGALSTARALSFLILLAVLVLVVAAPSRGAAYTTFMAELNPRVLNGSIWLFTAIAALILWYRLPLDSFYKAVLLSYVPYLLVFSLHQRYLGTAWASWPEAERFRWTQFFQYANQVAYVLLVAVWNVAIWRNDRSDRRAG